MSCINSLWIKLTSKQIGVDQFGNKYFIGRNKNYLGQNKRYVLYSGSMQEASKVPPLWHAWLHYMSDELPGEKDSAANYEWQQEHIPNVSGTKHAYDPTRGNTKNNNCYSSWKPN